MVARLKAQSAFMAGAKRNRENPFAKSTYATLEAVLAAVAEPMCEHGLVITQWAGDVQFSGPKGDRKHITIYTRIEHAESSEYMQCWLPVTITKDDAQGIGSAMTYGRRYTLKAALGIPEIDDDGAAASGQESEFRPKRKSAAEAKRNGGSEKFNEIKTAIEAAISVEHLQHLGETYQDDIAELPDQWRDMLRDDYTTQMIALRSKEAS